MRAPIWVRATAFVCLFAVTSCGGGGGGGSDPFIPVPPLQPGAGSTNFAAPDYASQWEIGPIIDGDNSSKGVPLHPSPHAEGISIDIPYPNKDAGHVHYVTFRHGSLAGKNRIVMEYKFEAAEGVKLVPTNFPSHPALLSLYFQRRGDDWTSVGYRWFSVQHNSFQPTDVLAGERRLAVAFTEPWQSIKSSWTNQSSPGMFDTARNETDRVGFVLGGGDGLGHGVYASGPAKLIITRFMVE